MRCVKTSVAAALTAAWAAVASAASLDLDAGSPAMRRVSDSPYLGAARAREIIPPHGVSLAGYTQFERRLPFADLFDRIPFATFFKPAVGTRDPLLARTMVLSQGRENIVMVSLDTVGVSAEFRRDLARRLAGIGLTEGRILVSATHTHSGPGGLSPNAFWEIAATDAFQSDFYDRVVDDVAALVREAWSAREDVTLHAASGTVAGLQRNRRDPARGVDESVNLMLMKSAEGAWLGGFVNFGVHGTSLRPDNLHFSGDVPGAVSHVIESRLESENGLSHRRTSVMFLSGVGGDVVPSQTGEGAPEAIAQEFGLQLEPLFLRLRTLPRRLEVTARSVELGAARLVPEACNPLKALAPIFPFLPTLRLSRVFPRSAEVSRVRIGDVDLLTWPGEPTVAAGRALRARAERKGKTVPWISALTNDYLAYFSHPDEMTRGGFEACLTLYGGDATVRVSDALADLL